MWQAITHRLSAHGYRCLAPLQRGYSAGAPPPRRRDYKIDDLAEDVRALIGASGAQRIRRRGFLLLSKAMTPAQSDFLPGCRNGPCLPGSKIYWTSTRC
jgi:hypothetical protein